MISPFNFPMALAAGPAGRRPGGAGTRSILKPSPQGSFTAAKLYECFRDAGLDPDVFHLLPGGDEVGAALVAHPGVSGLTFTGSYAVGMSIYRQFAELGYPKPVICEMGGKNPAIVSAPRRPRRGGGRGGPLRVRAVRAEVLRVLAGLRAAGRARGVRREAGRAGRVPGRRRPDVPGRVPRAGDQRRVGRAVRAGRRARAVRRGGRGRRERAARRGRAARRVLPRADRGDRAAGRRLDLPRRAVRAARRGRALRHPRRGPDAGQRHRPRADRGLLLADPGEVDKFLDEIQAGVVYVNRAAGATTGAWPGVQPFGGWKGSGTGGKAGGGLYYVQQYLREQSRTVVSSSELA